MTRPTFHDFLKKALSDSDVRTEYEALAFIICTFFILVCTIAGFKALPGQERGFKV